MNAEIKNEIHNAAENLKNCADKLSEKKVIVGFDGFVDVIIHPVATRQDKNHYDRIETITGFSERIASAAGKSANIEFVPLQEKIGGNGPLMAMAMYHAGCKVTNIGLLGYPDILSVFSPMKEHCKLISLGNPGHSDAIEFNDGKLILGKLETLKDFSVSSIDKIIGKEKFISMLAESGMVACTNWTMLTEMEEVLAMIIENMPAGTGAIFFFDLADPEKRTEKDKKKLISQLGELNKKSPCILGLNFREAEQISALLDIREPMENNAEGLKRAAALLQEKTGIYGVVIHALDCAAAVVEGEKEGIPGPFCPRPKLSTGGGDHFNGGFCNGLLAGLSLKDTLYMAVATSGWYVRNKKSPRTGDVINLLNEWRTGQLID